MSKRIVIPIKELVCLSGTTATWALEDRTLVVWEGKQGVLYTLESSTTRTWGCLGPGQLKLVCRESVGPKRGHLNIPDLSADKEVLQFERLGAINFVAPVGTFEKILVRFYDYEERDLLIL